MITVVVTDTGGVLNGGSNTFTRTFAITVTPVNQVPTLTALANATISENAPVQTVPLSGISAGLGDTAQSQFLTVVATSSNPNVVPNPTIAYTSPNTTGTLTYQPVANTSGTATITVTVMDSGSSTSTAVSTLTRTFTVTVNQVNQAPTIAPLNNQVYLENSTPPTITLSGISPGLGDNAGDMAANLPAQVLNIFATSSNTALIPNPVVTYTNPATTGTLALQPAVNASGTATITVVVQDNGGTAGGGQSSTIETFTVTVAPVNQPPTVNFIPNPPVVPVGAGQQSVTLSGITTGFGDAATGKATTSAANTVTSIAVVNGGNGYTSVPTVAISGGGGTARRPPPR